MDDKIKRNFLGLYQMMISDSEIHPKELELLYQIGKEKGFSEKDIQNVIFSPISFVTAEALTDEEKIEYLFDLARMAWADGVLDDKEKESLNNACKRLGFMEEYSNDITDFLLEQAHNKKNTAEVLEIIKTL
jgi:DnaJ-domain-containing protein 1